MLFSEPSLKFSSHAVITISLSLGYLCYFVHLLFFTRKLHNPHQEPGPAFTPPPPVDDATDSDNPPRDIRSVEAGLTVDQEEQPWMSVPMTIGLLVVVTVVC